MKYTSDQLKRIKNKEFELQGELQKSVWSTIRNNKEIRLAVIAKMLGRRNDSIYTTCQNLIEKNMIERAERRGFYKVSDSIYGYSPASIALPDIKTLNSMSKTILKAGQKMVDPPVILPHDGYILPFKTTPGSINYKTSPDEDKKVEVMDFKGNIPIGMELEEQRRTMIKRAFFVDLFLLLAQITDKSGVTATEIRERVNEKMLILGPVLGRLMHELLDPIGTRTFNILWRLGQLPPPPRMIAEGAEYKIEYVSPLAKAQKMSEAQSVENLIVSVRNIADAVPDVLDNINFDKTAKRLGEIYNVTDILRSDDEVEAIRQSRQDAAQTQQALEMANQGADVAKKVVEAEQTAKGGE